MDDISSNELVACKEESIVKLHVNENFGYKTRKKRDTSSNNEMENPEQNYKVSRNIAEGMMDIALLSANSNQLRFILTYNTESATFYISLCLIILSLALQVSVGIALILKKKNGKKSRMLRTNKFLVVGIFIITFVNVLIAAFTTTSSTDRIEINNRTKN